VRQLPHIKSKARGTKTAKANQHLGDRVRFWTTFNKPSVITNIGHLTGEQARAFETRVLRINWRII
jgi:hypothetical protein